MKILVVEDDKKIAAAVKRGLDGEGFSVEVSLDGDEGLWRATEYRYDLIILDLMLPGTSGQEICRSLREGGNWTPILVLTAHVRALLRRTSGGAPAPISVGDLRLDPGRHHCWRGEVEIPLTAREFAVLQYLMRRVDLVVPKFEILDGVWDYDFEGDPNIVEVYMGRLRRKVDDPFGRHDLETVRGAGYRLASHGP